MNNEKDDQSGDYVTCRSGTRDGGTQNATTPGANRHANFNLMDTCHEVQHIDARNPQKTIPLTFKPGQALIIIGGILPKKKITIFLE